MRPDRIVGLRLKEQYRPFFASNSLDITHSPIEGRSILYPFLVVEAKREDNAPGFRYVEAQTSFPIRRLLKIQDDLRNAHCSNLNPLVWFFAFQGEEWRLYAGTLKDSSVVVCVLSFAADNYGYILTRETENIPGSIRPLAWHNRVMGWCITTLPDRGLHLELGSRYISPSASLWARDPTRLIAHFYRRLHPLAVGVFALQLPIFIPVITRHRV